MSNWIPEIMYEEGSNLPHIQIPEGESMPGMLFVFSATETGEFEPDDEGNPLPILEMDLHQYADMTTLKNNLDAVTYDTVRAALGLEPLKDAEEKGRQISQNIRDNVE
tara:strand:- start:157 stop:480 length:324 start_codon:yes stop_codon:yes gene_type:complete